MKRTIVSFCVGVLAVGVVFANAQDAADLINLRQALTLDESVLNKGTGGSIQTAWDRLQHSPEDLPDVGPERTTTLGVWKDTKSEYDWIVFSQASNNSVQDAFGGGFLKPFGDGWVFGFSMGWYVDEHEDSFLFTDPSSFSGNTQEVSAEGYDMRASIAWALNDNMNLGFALDSLNQEADTEQDFTSSGGGSGFAIETENTGLFLTVGFKHYLNENSSYNLRAGFGQDTAEGFELDTSTDPMGVVTDQDWYLLDLEADTFKIAGQYNRRLDRGREWNIGAHHHNAGYDLQNMNIFFNIDSMGMRTSFEDAIGDDITDEETGLWFNFVKAWEETEWYCGLGYTMHELDSAILSIDPFSMFTFDENYVEEVDEIDIWVGFRHHFTDRFALFGSASYTQFNQDFSLTFTQRDAMGGLDFTDVETITWEEGDTNFHLGLEYVGDNFKLDAVYEPEDSLSSPSFRGSLPSPDLPGSGRNSVSSDRVTFAATFNW